MDAISRRNAKRNNIIYGTPWTKDEIDILRMWISENKEAIVHPVHPTPELQALFPGRIGGSIRAKWCLERRRMGLKPPARMLQRKNALCPQWTEEETVKMFKEVEKDPNLTMNVIRRDNRLGGVFPGRSDGSIYTRYKMCLGIMSGYEVEGAPLLLLEWYRKYKNKPEATPSQTCIKEVVEAVASRNVPVPKYVVNKDSIVSSLANWVTGEINAFIRPMIAEAVKSEREQANGRKSGEIKKLELENKKLTEENADLRERIRGLKEIQASVERYQSRG